MPGRLRKPAGTTSDARDGQHVVETRPLTVAVPRPRRDWPTEVKRAYRDFWASDVAVLAQPSDLASIMRLFDLRAERERCHDEVVAAKSTRLPLDVALEAGLVGTVVYEQVGEDLKPFMVLEHDGRVGLGSQGQMVLSPYARDLRAIDAEIRQLEDRFGLNFRERTRLAVVVRPAAPAGTPPSASGPTADPAVVDLINGF